MISIERVRQMAMLLPEVVELPHFQLSSFRIKKKIFATLWIKESRVMLKLSPVSQSVYCSYNSSIFFPVPGGWGLKGATFVDLLNVDEVIFKEALQTAYNERVTKKISDK